jgi:hypothetical protein
MFNMSKATAFPGSLVGQIERDASWYGTLAMLAASVGLLATFFFVG